MLSLIEMMNDIANRAKSTADYPIAVKLGTTGFVKWKSGRLEQWGTVTFPATSGAAISKITFPTEFGDTNYNVTMTGNGNFTSAVTGLFESNAAASKERTTKTTVVRIIKSGAAYAMTADYKASGIWK